MLFVRLLKMDTFVINNITLTNQKEPPKSIVLKEYQTKGEIWFQIFVTKCKNIYFMSSPKHPIYLYNFTKPTFLLSHFIYSMQEIIFEIEKNTNEFNFLNILMNNILNYLRSNSINSFKESSQDPVIRAIFFDFYLPVQIDPYLVSFMKNNYDVVRRDYVKMRKETKRMIYNFSKEIEDMKIKLIEAVSQKPKDVVREVVKEVVREVIVEKIVVEKQVEKVTVEVETQTEFRNDWRNIVKKPVPKMIEFSVKETQTEVIKEPELEVKKKNGKKKEDNVILTEKEFCKIMQDHKDEIEKLQKEEENKFMKNPSSYFKKKEMEFPEFAKLISYTNNNIVVDSLIVWNIQLVSKLFIDSMVEEGSPVMDIVRRKVPRFFDFWTQLILPEIDKMPHPVFKALKIEWIDLVSAIKRSGIDIQPIQIDMALAIHASCLLGETPYRQNYMPSFFSILLRACRNIYVLLSLISIFTRKYLDKNTKFCLLNDFEVLLTMATDRELLRKHRSVINDPALEIIFDINSGCCYGYPLPSI